MKFNKFFTFLVLIGLTINISASVKPKFTDFSLKDYKGTEHKLSDFKDSKGIVIMFIATRCPVSNAYNERMAELADDYEAKGFKFIGINSNKQEDLSEIKQHAEEHNFNFLILKDWENKIADEFGASVTPEVYVLDKDFNQLYHGRIDDSRRESDVSSNDLQNALDSILNGKEIEKDETKAFGCTIKRID